MVPFFNIQIKVTSHWGDRIFRAKSHRIGFHIEVHADHMFQWREDASFRIRFIPYNIIIH